VKKRFARPALKMDPPEKVLCKAYGQARPVADFLHENGNISTACLHHGSSVVAAWCYFLFVIQNDVMMYINLRLHENGNISTACLHHGCSVVAACCYVLFAIHYDVYGLA